MSLTIQRALTGASLELPTPIPGSLCVIGVSTHTASEGPLPPATPRPSKVRRWIVPLSCALAAVLLVTFLAGPIQQSFAASRFSESCSTQPSARFCNGQDPIGNQCQLDAKTVGQSLIIDDANNTFGRLEIRFSQTCQSYWGRAFSYLPHMQIFISVRDLGVTNADSSYEGPAPEVYSNMFFGSRPGIEASIIGTADRTPPSVYLPGTHG